MPKLYFGSRGGVYYKRKGRKVYVNRFGDDTEEKRKKLVECIRILASHDGLINAFEHDVEIFRGSMMKGINELSEGVPEESLKYGVLKLVSDNVKLYFDKNGNKTLTGLLEILNDNYYKTLAKNVYHVQGYENDLQYLAIEYDNNLIEHVIGPLIMNKSLINDKQLEYFEEDFCEKKNIKLKDPMPPIEQTYIPYM